MGDRKVVIKNADMAEDMQQDIAAFIKKDFDKK